MIRIHPAFRYFSILFRRSSVPASEQAGEIIRGNVAHDPGDFIDLVLCIPFDSAFSFGVPGILSAASMGLAVGLGYAFFSRGMKEDVQPTAAAIISNIEPVANPVWVFLFLGERPSAVSLLGFFMVLIAVTLYSAQTASSKGAKSV